MRVLAFDLAKTTGWAKSEDDGVISAGTLDLSKTMDRVQVYVLWGQWFRSMLTLHQPDFVTYEEPRFNRGFSYVPGMIALMSYFCDEVGISPIAATVQEIKIHATGGGGAKKPAMREAILAVDWADNVPDEENAIDAAWLVKWFVDTAEVVS
jgi:hypothetical protein